MTLSDYTYSFYLSARVLGVSFEISVFSLPPLQGRVLLRPPKPQRQLGAGQPGGAGFLYRFFPAPPPPVLLLSNSNNCNSSWIFVHKLIVRHLECFPSPVLLFQPTQRALLFANHRGHSWFSSRIWGRVLRQSRATLCYFFSEQITYKSDPMLFLLRTNNIQIWPYVISSQNK